MSKEIDNIIIGESKKVLELKFLIEKVAPSESTVLVLGETGTVKIGGTALNKIEEWNFNEKYYWKR